MSPFYIFVTIILGIIAAMFCTFVYLCWREENGPKSKNKASRPDELGDMERAMADREKIRNSTARESTPAGETAS